MKKVIISSLLASTMISGAISPVFADSYDFRHDNIQQINATSIDESPSRVNIIKELERKVAKTGKTSGVFGGYVWVKIGERFYSHSLAELRKEPNPSKAFQEIVSAQVAEDRIADLDVAIDEAEAALIEAIAALNEPGNSKNLFEIGKLRLDYLKTQQAFLAGQLGLEGFEPVSLDTLTEHERAYFDALNGFVQDYVSNVEVTDVTLSDAGRVTVTLSNGQELYIEDFANSYNQGHIDARDSLSHSVNVEGGEVTYSMTMHDGTTHSVVVDIQHVRDDAQSDLWNSKVVSVDVANKRVTFDVTHDDGTVSRHTESVLSVYNSVRATAARTSGTNTVVVTLDNGNNINFDAQSIFDDGVQSVTLSASAVTRDAGTDTFRATVTTDQAGNTASQEIIIDASAVRTEGVNSVTLDDATITLAADGTGSYTYTLPGGDTATVNVVVTAYGQARYDAGRDSVTLDDATITLAADGTGSYTYTLPGGDTATVDVVVTAYGDARFEAGQNDVSVSSGSGTDVVITGNGQDGYTATIASGRTYNDGLTAATPTRVDVADDGAVTVTLPSGAQLVPSSITFGRSYNAGVDAGEQAVVDAIVSGVAEISGTYTDATIVAAINDAIDGVGLQSQAAAVKVDASTGWNAGDYYTVEFTLLGVTTTEYFVVAADGTATRVTAQPTSGTNLGERMNGQTTADFLASLGTPGSHTIAVTLTSGSVISVDVAAVYEAGQNSVTADTGIQLVRTGLAVNAEFANGYGQQGFVAGTTSQTLAAGGSVTITAIGGATVVISAAPARSADSYDVTIGGTVHSVDSAADLANVVAAARVGYTINSDIEEGFDAGQVASQTIAAGSTVTITAANGDTVTVSAAAARAADSYSATVHGVTYTASSATEMSTAITNAYNAGRQNVINNINSVVGIDGVTTSTSSISQVIVGYGNDRFDAGEQAVVDAIVNGVDEITGARNANSIVAAINGAIDAIGIDTDVSTTYSEGLQAGDWVQTVIGGSTRYTTVNADGTVNPYVGTLPAGETAYVWDGISSLADALAMGRTIAVTLTSGTVIHVGVDAAYNAGVTVGEQNVLDAVNGASGITGATLSVDAMGVASLTLTDAFFTNGAFTAVTLDANGVVDTARQGREYDATVPAAGYTGAHGLDLSALIDETALGNALDAAYNDGFGDGYNEGYKDGYADGFADGRAN